MFVQICRKDGTTHRKALEDLWNRGGEVFQFKFLGGQRIALTPAEFFQQHPDVTMLIFCAGNFEARMMVQP